MPQDFADFLDELGSYVEQRITHLPPPLAEILSRPDAVMPMQELLYLLDCPDCAGLPAEPSAAEEKPGAPDDAPTTLAQTGSARHA